MREIGTYGRCRGATSPYLAPYLFVAYLRLFDAKSSYLLSVSHSLSLQLSILPNSLKLYLYP